jgi:hypothetical protein
VVSKTTLTETGSKYCEEGVGVVESKCAYSRDVTDCAETATAGIGCVNQPTVTHSTVRGYQADGRVGVFD